MQPPIQWTLGFFPRGKTVGGVMVTTHLNLAPRLRISTATPLLLLYAFVALTGSNLPFTITWHGRHSCGWNICNVCTEYFRKCTECYNLSAFVLQGVIILVSMSNKIPTDKPHLPKYEMISFTFFIMLRKMVGCLLITHKFKKFKHVLYIYFLENSRLWRWSILYSGTCGIYLQ
jgi:hypothetical protein